MSWWNGLTVGEKVAVVSATFTALGVLVAVIAVWGDFTRDGSNDAAPSPTTTVRVVPNLNRPSTTTAAEPTSSDMNGFGTSSQAAPADPVKIVNVQVHNNEAGKISAGLHQLGTRRTLDFRYWWTTITNYGPIDGTENSCTVEGTLTNEQGMIVDIERSARCSLEGWHSPPDLPQGRYTLTVSVKLASGATGEGVYAFAVVP